MVPFRHLHQRPAGARQGLTWRYYFGVDVQCFRSNDFRWCHTRAHCLEWSTYTVVCALLRRLKSDKMRSCQIVRICMHSHCYLRQDYKSCRKRKNGKREVNRPDEISSVMNSSTSGKGELPPLLDKVSTKQDTRVYRAVKWSHFYHH